MCERTTCSLTLKLLLDLGCIISLARGDKTDDVMIGIGCELGRTTTRGFGKGSGDLLVNLSNSRVA